MQNFGQGFSSSPSGPGISAGLEAIAQVERARIVRLFEIARSLRSIPDTRDVRE
jgi:hypothetical protein